MEKVIGYKTILSGRFCFVNYVEALLRKCISLLSLYEYFTGNSIVVCELHWLVPNSMARLDMHSPADLPAIRNFAMDLLASTSSEIKEGNIFTIFLTLSLPDECL